MASSSNVIRGSGTFSLNRLPASWTPTSATYCPMPGHRPARTRYRLPLDLTTLTIRRPDLGHCRAVPHRFIPEPDVYPASASACRAGARWGVRLARAWRYHRSAQMRSCDSPFLPAACPRDHSLVDATTRTSRRLVQGTCSLIRGALQFRRPKLTSTRPGDE